MPYVIVCLLLLFPLWSFSCDEEKKPRPCIVVLYGPRGSGKAAIAVRLHSELSIPAVSFASLLANHLVEKTPLGEEALTHLNRNEEIPRDITLSIIRHRLQQSDCDRGVILEEIPQDVEQAQCLGNALQSSHRFLVINIETSDAWLKERASSRLYCRVCGKVYMTSPTTPNKKEYCDACAGNLQRRSDDASDAVQARLTSYKVNMAPLLEFFRTRNELISIPGDRPFEELYEDVQSTIVKNTTIAPIKPVEVVASATPRPTG